MMERKKIEKLIKLGMFDDAYVYINSITENNTLYDELLPLKGYIEYKLEKYEIAKETLKISIKNNLNNEEPWKYLGEIYLHENELNKAYAAFKMCLKKLGATVYVYKRVISLALLLGKYDEAKFYANQSTKHWNMRQNKKVVDMLQSYINNFSERNQENDNQKTVFNVQDYDKKNIEMHIRNEKLGEYCFMSEIELIKPGNRYELIMYVYELINKNEIEKALKLIQNAFWKENMLENAQYIVFIEWYDLLYRILLKICDTKYCMLKLNIANTIFFIFEKCRKEYYMLVFYLLDEQQYDEILKLLPINFFDMKIYNKTKETVKEVLLMHPKYDLKDKNCDCCNVDNEYKVLYDFYIKTKCIERNYN